MGGHYGGLGPTAVAVVWVQFAIALSFVLARIWARKIIIHAFGLDDILMIISMVLFVGFATGITFSAYYGLGQTVWSFIPDKMTELNRASLCVIMGTSFAIIIGWTSKAAVAFFLLRLVTKKWHKYVLWWCIVSTGIMNITSVFFYWMNCRPFKKAWSPQTPGTCWVDMVALAQTFTSYAIVMDVVLALLPWNVVWKLNMKRSERLIVACGLSLGFVAAVAGIIRVTYVQRIDVEPIRNTVHLIIWSSTEACITIICACIPVLRPLWSKIFGKPLRSTKVWTSFQTWTDGNRGTKSTSNSKSGSAALRSNPSRPTHWGAPRANKGQPSVSQESIIEHAPVDDEDGQYQLSPIAQACPSPTGYKGPSASIQCVDEIILQYETARPHRRGGTEDMV